MCECEVEERYREREIRIERYRERDQRRDTQREISMRNLGLEFL